MNDLQNGQDPATSTPLTPWWIRLLCVIVGLGLWFSAQSLIKSRGQVEEIVDQLLVVTEQVNVYLNQHDLAADLLLVTSSAIIDALAIFLLLWSVAGRSIRPFLGLLMLFAMRQICQGLCGLPAPDGMIWRQPELFGLTIPGLLVTYTVGNDFFFSGHTAIAVYGAVELARLGRKWLMVLATAVAVFEIGTVIALRAHWTMDVFAGVVAALYAAELARRLAPACDRRLAALSRRWFSPA